MLTLTPTALKNLFSKRATRLYPFEVRGNFDMYRGTLHNDIDSCIFCGMCARKCPSQCITVDRKKGTWELDPFACILCGVCVDNCPPSSLSMDKEHRKPLSERGTLLLTGTPPKPKKKAAPSGDAAPKAEKKAAPKAKKSTSKAPKSTKK